MSSDVRPRPLLTDFGISHALNPGMMTMQLITNEETASGSIPFMAKEMFTMDREHFYTKETDVWAFGMTIYVGDCILCQVDCAYP